MKLQGMSVLCAETYKFSCSIPSNMWAINKWLRFTAKKKKKITEDDPLPVPLEQLFFLNGISFHFFHLHRDRVLTH